MRDFIKRLVEQIKGLIRSQIARDSGVLLIANYASTGLSVVTSIILARTLGAYNLGLVILAQTLVTTIIQFMDIRTGDVLIRFMGSAIVREKPREAATYLNIALLSDFVLMLVTVGITALLIPWASTFYQEPETIHRLAMIFLYMVPTMTIEGPFSSILNMYKKFNLRAAGTLIIGLVRLGVLVGFSQHGMEALSWGYVIVSTFSFLLWFVLAIWLLVKNLPTLRGENYREAWKQFLPFAFHSSVTTSIKAIAINIDVLILGALRPANIVSYYEIANSAASLITIPTAPVSMVIYPELNEAWALEKMDRVKRLIKKYTRATFIITFAIYAFLAAFANGLVRLLYGVEYMPVASLIRIVGLGWALESLLRWVRPATLARGKPQLATFYSVAAILVRIALLIPLIYFFGAVGAAWTYVLVVIFTIGLVAFYVMPRLGLGLSGWRGAEDAVN
ncbi:MAG: oligosaccharide flippase family protein [Anaerolineae bacterium]|nr:oligosaccharide flippase family protein [Anaerolineae bacterium]